MAAFHHFSPMQLYLAILQRWPKSAKLQDKAFLLRGLESMSCPQCGKGARQILLLTDAIIVTWPADLGSLFAIPRLRILAPSSKRKPAAI